MGPGEAPPSRSFPGQEQPHDGLIILEHVDSNGTSEDLCPRIKSWVSQHLGVRDCRERFRINGRWALACLLFG